jgi:hypothetical protein
MTACSLPPPPMTMMFILCLLKAKHLKGKHAAVPHKSPRGYAAKIALPQKRRQF